MNLKILILKFEVNYFLIPLSHLFQSIHCQKVYTFQHNLINLRCFVFILLIKNLSSKLNLYHRPLNLFHILRCYSFFLSARHQSNF